MGKIVDVWNRADEKQTSKTRVKIENCQTWLVRFVTLMVEDGVFPKEALVELKSAPKN